MNIEFKTMASTIQIHFITGNILPDLEVTLEDVRRGQDLAELAEGPPRQEVAVHQPPATAGL